MNCQISPKSRCPTDERNYLELEGDCFYLETRRLSFSEAQTNCAGDKFLNGGSLFEPKTLAENDKVLKSFGKLLGKKKILLPKFILYLHTESKLVSCKI